MKQIPNVTMPSESDLPSDARQQNAATEASIAIAGTDWTGPLGFTVKQRALRVAFRASRIGGSDDEVELCIQRDKISFLAFRRAKASTYNEIFSCEADIPLVKSSSVVHGKTVVVRMGADLFANLLCQPQLFATEDAEIAFVIKQSEGRKDRGAGVPGEHIWSIRAEKFEADWPFQIVSANGHKVEVRDGQQVGPDRLGECLSLLQNFASKQKGYNPYRNIRLAGGEAKAGAPEAGAARIVDCPDLPDLDLLLSREQVSDLLVVVPHLDSTETRHWSDGDAWGFYDERVRCWGQADRLEPDFTRLPNLTSPISARALEDEFFAGLQKIISQTTFKEQYVHIAIDGEELGSLIFTFDVIDPSPSARPIIEGVHRYARVTCPVTRECAEGAAEHLVRQEGWLKVEALDKLHRLKGSNYLVLRFVGDFVLFEQVGEDRRVCSFMHLQGLR